MIKISNVSGEDYNHEDFFLPFSARSAALREKIRIMEPNEVAAQIVDAACQIHDALGPGLLEMEEVE
jgi:hypothetical protein